MNLSPEQWQERQKARITAKNRKRRMRLNAAPWDGVTDEAILERDRWTCRMPDCIYGSRRISKTRKFPDRRSASIDHILPLSLGGDDTQYNKRAAHLGCNVIRNTQLDNQMPLAFGADLDAIPRFYQPRQKLCPVCNEPIDGKRCDLHMPVYYFTCHGCGNLAASRYKNSQVCGSPECHHASYLRRVQAREPHKRALQAHAMHEQGMAWSEIAAQLGYSAANVAASAAARATGRRSARKQGEYVRLPRVSVPSTHQASA